MTITNSHRFSVSLLFTIILLATGPKVNADFAFAIPKNMREEIPVIKEDSDIIIVDCFSSDGLEMYISSNRPGGQGDGDIWVLRRSSANEDWGLPENLGPAVNSGEVDEQSSISTDGLTLFFVSRRPGGYGGQDIYVSTRPTKNAPWGQAMNMGMEFNSSTHDGSPWISADGLELYFGSYKAGGYGTWDIYVTHRVTINDPWGDPENLGPVLNSEYSEVAYSLSLDGRVFLFSGNPPAPTHRPGGYGGADMWMARRETLSEPWGEPINLGPNVNSIEDDICPRISPDGSMLYFTTVSNTGALDCWQADIIPLVDFNGDGIVDSADMRIMVDYWGTNNSLCDIGPMPWGDDLVDVQDLIVFSELLFEDINDPTLIAHWALDETEGDAAKDSVSGEDAFVMGEPVWQPDGGMVDGALELDGMDDCIISSISPNPAEEVFSIVAWIKGGSPGQGIISQPNGSDWLAVDAEGKLMTGLNGLGQSSVPLFSQASISDGQWHHIGLVWDGSRRTLGVDGVIVAEDTQDGEGVYGSGLYIGVGKDYAAGTYFSGLIDDVRIYNRAVNP